MPQIMVFDLKLLSFSSIIDILLYPDIHYLLFEVHKDGKKKKFLIHITLLEFRILALMTNMFFLYKLLTNVIAAFCNFY